MPITLITGPANAGKAQVAMAAVRRHLAHGEEPLLVVPTRTDVEYYLRELAGAGTVLGVRVERFAALIGEAVRRAGVGEAVLGAVARERLIEALTTRAGMISTPGFVRALGELFAELRVRRVAPGRLREALASALTGSGHARLGQLFAEYCAALERLGRMDQEQRAVCALDELRERPALWGATPVVVYGFDDLTPLQLDAIETLGRVVDAPVTVTLAYEPGRMAFAGRAGSYHALAPLASELRVLPARAEHYAPGARTALSHLERSLFEPVEDGRERVADDGTLTLLEGGGERAELELVTREIGVLLGEGMAADEIAVLVRGGSGATDLDLLEEVFTAAGIPFALTRRRRFADSATGRALVGMLRCVPDLARSDGGSHGELGDLLAWLRAPGLPAAAASDGGASAVERLELSARRAGALDADGARALWEERMWPLDTLDRFAEAQAQGGRALCERAARELQWLFAVPRRGRAQVLASDERKEAQALSVGRQAVTELRELARSAPELAPSSAADLAHALEQLELLGGAHAAPAPSGAVAVLDPLALRARRVRALFVCGLQEGVFPAPGRPQPILSEEERRRLAESAGLRLGASEPHDALAAERYLLYAAVSRPQERLFLSWHLADDDGQASPRSLFVDDVCDLFAPSLVARTLHRPLGAVDGIDAELPRRLGTSSRRVLRHEHVLSQLHARAWSASSLEKWIGCPVRWFVERMLGPDAFEPDSEPLARGSLAHIALRHTLEALRRETGSARLTPATLERARELLRAALAEHEDAYPLSVAPERRLAVRRRLWSDLERYLEHAAVCASPATTPAGALEPYALELAFGFPAGDASSPEREGERGEGSTLPPFDLGDGVMLRGRIDRVDVGPAGEAVVYDYKGARAPASARWIRDGDLQVALYMCAVEELLQVRAVGGFYQPLTGDDLRARGLLDADACLELDCVSSDVREHDDARELLAAARAAARAAAGEAARGELAARPQTCAFRGGCMYPSICRCER